MNQRAAFRRLIVAQLALLLVQQAAGASTTSAALTAPSLSPGLLVLGAFILVFGIATLVGLWQFRRWSRWAFAAGLVLSLILTGTSIPSLPPETPLESAILHLVWLSYGAQLVWMYGTPLAAEFQPRAA